MPVPSSTLIDVRSLIDHPGATKSLDRVVPTPADLSDDIVRIGPQATVAAVIDSVVDGLLVRGAVTAPATLACARCLAKRSDEITAEVVELFRAPGTDGGEVDAGYDIADATIDIDTLLRDALAAAIPVRPLCRPDCAGLCPTCGADRNVAPCDGHPQQGDQRWAALADLQLPDAR